jgi:signal transduction histidine kinase/CheY-like chemotaxis protein
MTRKAKAQDKDSDAQQATIEQQLASLSKFSEENSNPVMRIANDGTLMYANPAAISQLADWNLELGTAAPDLLLKATKVASKKSSDDQCEIEYNDRTYAFAIAHVKDAGYANLYGRDISDYKRSEEERFAANQQLQASNQQLTAMEQQLRAANQQLTSLSKFPEENSNPVMRIADDGTLMYANPAAITLLADWNLESGSAAPDLLLKATKAASKKSIEDQCEIAYSGRVYAFAIAAVKDAGYANLYGRDITARKRFEEERIAANQQLEAANQQLSAMEQQLRAANQQLTALSKFPEENNNPVLRIADDGTLIYANPAAISQLADWNLESGSAAPDLLLKATETVSHKGSEDRCEVDYSDRIYAFEIAAVKDAGYTNLYGRDITARKCSEEELRKSNRQLEESMKLLKKAQEKIVHQARLSALGQMTSGIAHDFNNVLMPIVGLTSLIVAHPDECLADREELLTMMGQVQEAAEDARLIVRRLRLINTSNADNVLKPVDLNVIVESAVNLSKPRWKEQRSVEDCPIELTLELSSPPCPILGSKTELREALLNLIFNAVDAMPEGGKMRVYTSHEPEYAVVGIEDAGMGMTKEQADKSVEAFYTTKGSEGSGLGLSMVHGIVQRHHGTLDISSEPGKGTTVKILLPFQSKTVKSKKQLEPPAKCRPLKVCVVDDDTNSLAMAVMLLEKDGHDVVPLPSGADALELLEQSDVKWDLIMSDRAMAGVNGDRVLAEAKRLHPDTPTVLITGFGDIMADAGELPPGVDKVVPKPFTRRDLRAAINELLVGEPEATDAQ